MSAGAGPRPAGVGPSWLAVVGDIMIQRALTEAELADPVFQIVREAGLGLANLEAPLTAGGRPAEKAVNMRMDPERVADVAAMGFGAVSLANNHMLDFGPEGMWATMETLDQAGIAHAGAGGDVAAAMAPRFLDVGGARVALLSVACTLPVGFAATADGAGIAPIRVEQSVALDSVLWPEQPGTSPFVHTRAHEPDVEAFTAVVRQAAGEADFTVVMIHWGVPPGWAAPAQGILAEYQRPLAHRLIDAGADLIAGHHPHALHPVETYRGRLICYSLGNFVFRTSLARLMPPAETGDPEPPVRLKVPAAPYRNVFGGEEQRLSVLLLVDRVDGGVAYTFVPVELNPEGIPRLAPPERAEAVLGRLVFPARRGRLDPGLEIAPVSVGGRPPVAALRGLLSLERR